MFLIDSQHNNINTILRLHHYDNRHMHEWLSCLDNEPQ